ncbi:MAG: ECF-type sigma factor [bacterium]|nr:ECF-type sigma factor [bacterium]
MADVTHILSKIESGDAQAANELLPLVYEELRRLAAGKMASENPGQTLQATALVHDAYIRLVDKEAVQHWNSRGHFFAAAAEAMRRILIEQARKKRGPKAGGELNRVSLSHADPEISDKHFDIIALSDALEELESQDARAAKVVKLRFFAGLTISEVASALGVSPATIKTDWVYAKNWLRAALSATA